MGKRTAPVVVSKGTTYLLDLYKGDLSLKPCASGLWQMYILLRVCLNGLVVVSYPPNLKTEEIFPFKLVKGKMVTTVKLNLGIGFFTIKLLIV